MKRQLVLALSILFLTAFVAFAQQSVPVGKGSYAEFPPDAVAYDDGYFAHPYRWFERARTELNLHQNVMKKPLPTNDWWTEFVFRGTGRIQPDYHVPPVTVTTDGDRFGCEAWAYPYVLTAYAGGFEVFYPKEFADGGMKKGKPLKIGATSVVRANDENVLFADFETAHWPDGWTVTVNTEDIPGPMATDEIRQSPTPMGYVGNRFVNSFKGDAAKLSIVSPVFTIEKKYIRLYAGGGNYPEQTCVGLFVDGQKVRNATGENGPVLKQYTWDVSEYEGQEAEIRITDDSGSGWGFIMCDEIVFTDNAAGGAGYTPDFGTTSAKVADWNDLGFTLRSEMNGNYMDATLVHGVPFVYVELNGLHPILVPAGSATVYDAEGEVREDFPFTTGAFAVEFDGRTYGVHAPAGSKLYKSNGGDFQIEMPAGKRYVVVSTLPDKSLLGRYDRYARNKPGDAQFNCEYKVEEGKIYTTFDLKATNMDSGAENQPTLMAFLPHHYRTSERNFEFIADADYQLFRGRMHTGAASAFTFAYRFGGMAPYLPEPLNLSDERTRRLNVLMDYSSTHYTVNGNTYAKGLGENSTLMLMAKSTGHEGFDLLRRNLKSELVDWLTFDDAEREQKQRYFAQYPHYGAMIGFPPGYGSQGFNDLHFHNGYFAVGAARLMMVDKEFKRDYAGMAKLIVQNYANWERYANDNDVYMPFLRTFDPYLGHSFAGGIGDGGGNNQESSSEAINSWFGVYLMGVELNDKKMIDVGATGYLLEMTAAGEYWLDLYGDNFPATYGHDYAGIVRTDNLAWATYFAGDPAWVLGIQACPADFFYTHFGLKPEKMTQINQSMFHDRTTFVWDGKPMHENDDPFDNIRAMGPYLGGYHLNIMNYIDPENASKWIDDLCGQEGAEGTEWRTHPNTTTNYYLSNAMLTYGLPARGYHTNIPSGAVYQNAKGELTYLLYNATDKETDVNIYKDGAVVETIKVGAGKYYNSRMIGAQQPTVSITNYADGDEIVLNKTIKIAASAYDKDGQVLKVAFFVDEQLVGTSYTEPFETSYKPLQAGTIVLTAIATDNDGVKSDAFSLRLTVLPIEQTPFTGTAWNIPQDNIPAVRFDNGGEGISYHDNEPAMQGGDNYRQGTGVETENTANGDGNIGWTNTGEWYEYTVEVREAGVYDLSSRLSSAGGGALRIFFDGADVTGAIPVESTGSWGDYENVHLANIPLKAGTHILRVMIDRAGMNLGSYRFTLLPDEKFPSEVDAGDDRIVYSPENTATLSAVATTVGDAEIVSYEWKQSDANPAVNIVSPNRAQTQVTALQLGTYVFEITITDSNGFTASDQTAVVVLQGNYAPIAHPGSSMTIPVSQAEVLLDGSASYDPDGTIVNYEWMQIDANNALTITQESASHPTATLTGFEKENLYVIQLTVTDNEGLSASENMRIYVESVSANNDAVREKGVVYPNPFSEMLVVSLPERNVYGTLKIYSITGSLLFQQDIADRSTVELNTHFLHKGCYVLTLESNTAKTVVHKIVK
jgi:hypothetical protein